MKRLATLFGAGIAGRSIFASKKSEIKQENKQANFSPNYDKPSLSCIMLDDLKNVKEYVETIYGPVPFVNLANGPTDYFYGFALVPLRPVPSTVPLRFGEVERKNVVLRPEIKPLNLVDIPHDAQTRELCKSSLNEEHATSITAYLNILPGRKSWQINMMRPDLVTSDMALISIQKGYKLEDLAKHLQSDKALIDAAAEVHDIMMSLAPEGDVFI